MSIVKKKSKILENPDVIQNLSWKSLPLLKKYVSRFDEIKPRKYNKHSVSSQKILRKHVIRAKEIWLLPYKR